MANIIYKPLTERFNKYGYTFTLLKREGDVAIFKQHKKKKIYNYEVIIVDRHDGYEISGNKFPPSEFYPSTSEWGSKGYTCGTLEAAEIRFKQLQSSLMQKEKERQKETNKPTKKHGNARKSNTKS